jgi:hypothetical protein
VIKNPASDKLPWQAARWGGEQSTLCTNAFNLVIDPTNLAGYRALQSEHVADPVTSGTFER